MSKTENQPEQKKKTYPLNQAQKMLVSRLMDKMKAKQMEMNVLSEMFGEEIESAKKELNVPPECNVFDIATFEFKEKEEPKKE